MPDTWIYMTHPDVKGPPVKRTQHSFDKLYKRKGWVVVDKPVKTEAEIKAAEPKPQPPRFPVEVYAEGKPRDFKAEKKARAATAKKAKEKAAKKTASKK